MKEIQIGNEEVNVFLFADNVLLNTEEPKDFTKRLLELMERFYVTEYKINVTKLTAFEHTNTMDDKQLAR